MRQLLKTRDAAKITGYSEAHIRKLVRDGELKATKIKPGAQLRFLEVDLLNLTNAPQTYPMAEDIKKRPGKK